MAEDPKKILIADDNTAIRDVYKEKLESLGYEVLIAADGEELVETAKQEIPALILTELVLPKKSGFEILIELRKEESLKRTPIFVITDEGNDDDIRKALQLGASLYFVKTKSRLVDIIQNIEGVLENK